jgi:hypothetical protein
MSQKKTNIGKLEIRGSQIDLNFRDLTVDSLDVDVHSSYLEFERLIIQ